MRVAEITECRRGANGQMPSDLRGEKGVALPGTPVEWFTVKQKANNAPKSSSQWLKQESYLLFKAFDEGSCDYFIHCTIPYWEEFFVNAM